MFRVKEVIPKSEDPDIIEITEPSSSTVQKKSRLDDDDTTIPDDGQIWSKPLGETRETTRLIKIFFLSRFYFSKILFREDEFDEYLQTLFF